ncbi:hypothetical protein P3F83_18045 [Mycobacteroides immunogenum]|uniref:hypothetical protein n=1 Tax=Mycobacteroides immunogenum TaxID=83262 RepID=UPI0025B7838D|nr:hypothetical protein [Mycobacteroides immunogenum]WJR32413.1 hypothetical protein P3F83_18045 [Mycobacteroides immunogenum]
MNRNIAAVGAVCTALAAATALLTYAVVMHIAPGERPRDPRITEPHGRFGW